MVRLRENSDFQMLPANAIQDRVGGPIRVPRYHVNRVGVPFPRVHLA